MLRNFCTQFYTNKSYDVKLVTVREDLCKSGVFSFHGRHLLPSSSHSLHLWTKIYIQKPLVVQMAALYRGRHIVHGLAPYITIITSRCPRCYFSSIILVMARWRGVSKYLWRFLRFTLQADTDGWPNISPTFHPLDPRFPGAFSSFVSVCSPRLVTLDFWRWVGGWWSLRWSLRYLRGNLLWGKFQWVWSVHKGLGSSPAASLPFPGIDAGAGTLVVSCTERNSSEEYF